ncbi:protein Star-like [Eriocheir sinensis]|uniref:protein Star-like n=1 Tax=Eriocheir sinensis TaxID=95602 RepID=UPI0021C9B6B7|nr:protein Star-like [Eriocheir sinensis]
MIYHHLLVPGQRGGFFVEAGALDGQMLSNSLWLERELGWMGLLVEPDPMSYSWLVTKHRKAWTSNTCLSHTGVTKASVHVSLTLPAGYRARPWYMKGSSYEFGVTLNSPSINKFVNAADKSYSVVSCFPLVTYLRALNVSTIDFLSLDTQGSEMEILKTIPWDEVNVRAVVVEIIGSRTGARFLSHYMKSLGFTLVGQYHDSVFVKEGDPALDKLRSKDGWELVVISPTEEESEVTTTGKGQEGQ